MVVEVVVDGESEPCFAAAVAAANGAKWKLNFK